MQILPIYGCGQNVFFIATSKYAPIGMKFGMHTFLTYWNIFGHVEQHLIFLTPCSDGPV